MTKETIEAAVRAAFAEVLVPAHAILQPAYANSDDAYELQQILSGMVWTEVSRRDLFRHREMLVALSGEAYQAYVPAYLLAAIADDDEYGADLRQYLVHSLGPLSESEIHVQTAEERLSRLDVAQRAAIAETLRFLVENYRDKAAAAILSAAR
jgi:hypothetical protein